MEAKPFESDGFEIWPIEPSRLEIWDRPELLIFPDELNFVWVKEDSGYFTLVYSRYLPDVETYSYGDVERLVYLNEFASGGDYINLSYKRALDAYSAEKFLSGEFAYSLAGIGWQNFYGCLSATGLRENELYHTIFQLDDHHSNWS